MRRHRATRYDPLDESATEVKRRYMRPQFRGRHLAQALLNRTIQSARVMGYTQLYADTLANIVEAQKLYEKMGFQKVAPYPSNRTPGAIYLKLSLGAEGTL